MVASPLMSRLEAVPDRLIWPVPSVEPVFWMPTSRLPAETVALLVTASAPAPASPMSSAPAICQSEPVPVTLTDDPEAEAVLAMMAAAPVRSAAALDC